MTISSKITKKEDGDRVVLRLNPYIIKNYNMQDAGNAFEGWACAIRCKENKDVILDIDLGINEENIDVLRLKTEEYAGHGNGHICRFFYRVIKFKQQYDWFSVSEYLKPILNDFENYLTADDIYFVNNPPTKDAEDNCHKENIVESKLAEKGKLKDILGEAVNIGEEVYRQLPVGLFVGKKSKDNSVFTYGHSAIDLWSIHEDTISIVELKAKNRMIGIITEIFFYVNYINDFINPKCPYRFELAEPTEGKSSDSNRGYLKLYDKIKTGNLKNVVGIMLADDGDRFHPCIDQKLIDIMDRNSANFKYKLAMYHVPDFNIEKSKIDIK
ncbi:hypothetical protein SAMN02910377_02581 [Pseudobutyrivibrio ruminis]|uniref:Uncharacterized protein n=1 Tax=Pseudobutyrivibrio ruminis TaxID=46206 RepID=A0A1H7M7T3_9FIRM|nr:hypothetical protein [Pseudobutyrivibrio ruminis]SEL07253.1 hypothetical protein SAMN02910377_02581 [Pseudobutyrivibrio ruminis]